MTRIGVGIAGFGLSGSVFHGPLIASLPDNYKLVAIQTSREDAVKAAYPEVTVKPEFDQLITCPGVDLVVIGVPNKLHVPYAKKALQAGKHVVLEKPFTPSFESAKELIEIAKSSLGLLTVFHNRRYDDDFLTLKRLIDSKDLGDIIYFESHFDRFRLSPDDRWKEQPDPGSGNFFDLGSHLIDQALQLFGSPHTVFGDVTAQRDGAQAADYFHAVLGYDRLRCILHGSTLASFSPLRLLAHGTLGSFYSAGLDSQEDRLKQGQGTEPPAAKRRGEIIRPDGSRQEVPLENGDYQAFYRDLAESIKVGRPPVVRPQEAAQVIEVIEACLGAGPKSFKSEWTD